MDKDWSELTQDEKLNALLEWAMKTHVTIAMLVKTVNVMADLLDEKQGVNIGRIKPYES